MNDNFKPHLFLKNSYTSQKYTSLSKSIKGKPLPERDRQTHGDFVISTLKQIWEVHNLEISKSIENNIPVKKGEYITIVGASNELLELNSLGGDGAKLLNVKSNPANNSQEATIYVPDNKQDKLIGKIQKYLNQDTKKGLPANQKLIAKIEEVHRANIENIWSGAIEYIPKNEPVWCELWLAIEESERKNHKKSLISICEYLNIQLYDEFTFFPERVIVNVKLNYIQLVDLIYSFGWIAEIRRAEELNGFWLDQTVVNRENWIESALNNITFNESNNYISILDSGINNGHQLLKDPLSDNDRLTVDPNWGKNDSGHNGHGTAMAGISLYGNLNNILENNTSLGINHKLESIKILPPDGLENDLDKCHFITQNAVNTAIINNSDYKRIFCMAITGKNQNDFGKPSTWSAYLDNIIFGEDDNDKKLSSYLLSYYYFFPAAVFMNY